MDHPLIILIGLFAAVLTISSFSFPGNRKKIIFYSLFLFILTLFVVTDRSWNYSSLEESIIGTWKDINRDDVEWTFFSDNVFNSNGDKYHNFFIKRDFHKIHLIRKNTSSEVRNEIVEVGVDFFKIRDGNKMRIFKRK